MLPSHATPPARILSPRLQAHPPKTPETSKNSGHPFLPIISIFLIISLIIWILRKLYLRYKNVTPIHSKNTQAQQSEDSSFNGNSTNQIYSDADDENKNSRNDVIRRDQLKSKQYEEDRENAYKGESNGFGNGDNEGPKEDGGYGCDPLEEFEIGDEGIDELNTIGMDLLKINLK
jgi:hypothetical protein